MDMGIVNAGQLMLYSDLDENLRTHVEDVLFDRRGRHRTPRHPCGVLKGHNELIDWRGKRVPERLKYARRGSAHSKILKKYANKRVVRRSLRRPHSWTE